MRRSARDCIKMSIGLPILTFQTDYLQEALKTLEDLQGFASLLQLQSRRSPLRKLLSKNMKNNRRLKLELK